MIDDSESDKNIDSKKSPRKESGVCGNFEGGVGVNLSSSVGSEESSAYGDFDRRLVVDSSNSTAALGTSPVNCSIWSKVAEEMSSMLSWKLSSLLPAEDVANVVASCECWLKG